MQIQVLNIDKWIQADQMYYKPMRDLKALLIRSDFAIKFTQKPEIGTVANDILSAIALNLCDLFARDIVISQNQSMLIEVNSSMSYYYRYLIGNYNYYVDTDNVYNLYRKITKKQ